MRNIIYGLQEDIRPRKLPVLVSSKIKKRFSEICSYNHDNTIALNQLSEYLEGVKDYISNPAIAFDYIHRYAHFPNGATHLMELGYDVSFIVKSDNTNGQPFVYIFDINLNCENFGLTDPSNIKEYKIHNIMNKTNKIRLTESQLHNLIKECVRKTLQEGKKKDPMPQWFADFDKASKFRETMDYIKKGGRNPLMKSKTNNIKEGRMLNEYEDYVGEIYDGEPLGEIKDGEVREFARKIFIHVANEITNLQRKYSDDYELCGDLQDIGELCMMAKCGL